MNMCTCFWVRAGQVPVLWPHLLVDVVVPSVGEDGVAPSVGGDVVSELSVIVARKSKARLTPSVTSLEWVKLRGWLVADG
jgi:hypothetical protein